MADINKDDLSLLIKELGKFYTGVRVMEVQFSDQCGCYSDWTTEAARLEVTISAPVANPNGDVAFRRRCEAEEALDRRARRLLEWHGCDSCGGRLSVYLQVIPRNQGRRP